MMKYIYACIASLLVCAGVSPAVSADRLFNERFGMQPDTSYYDDTVRDQAGEHDTFERDLGDATPDFGQTPDLSPSVDMPGSVHGHTGGLGGTFGGGISSADPSVEGLSHMDGGGFAPPGSYTGSPRRP
ncbi:MAG TPA: hypothetical protein VLE46_18220 [Nitrospira sp.]|nr:hypothetical protein [Nitrospira sp.]